jgi:single-strand DNA-binding protein
MFNRVTILGNLGNDPELRFTSGGTPVANFSVATNEHAGTDKESGEKKQITNFHRIVAWGKLGETCAQYLNKGRQVLIEGRIQYRSFDDKEGAKRNVTEIVASRVQFLGGPRKESSEEATSEAPSTPVEESASEESAE